MLRIDKKNQYEECSRRKEYRKSPFGETGEIRDRLPGTVPNLSRLACGPLTATSGWARGLKPTGPFCRNSSPIADLLVAPILLLIQIFRGEFKGDQGNQQSRDGEQGEFAERASVEPPGQDPEKAKHIAQPNPPHSNLRTMVVLDHEKDEPSGCHSEKEKRNKTQHGSDH